jgi:pimeloyl-ACP methyl ester carboxylesterase
MPYFQHEAIEFHFQEVGQGYPFIFQHGLGGDVNQPLGLLQQIQDYRLAAFDCRGHGATQPLGDPERFSLASFAEDLLAFLNHMGYQQAVIGGISMGAAVALNFALRHPGRISGLILSRPAWLDRPDPPNLAVYDLIAQLIRTRGAHDGRAAFLDSDVYQHIRQESPDAANSLVGQFENNLAEVAVIRLERIPHCAPMASMSDLDAIQAPTMIMASQQDPIHPIEYGRALAQAIKGATFRELTPKSTSTERHAADVRRHIADFLRSLQLPAKIA